MSTIAITDDVHRRLIELKTDWAASSLNDVVARLLEENRPVPRSMFGVDPKLPRLDRKRRDEMWA
jgi:predicted CopG family antitoxin